MRELEGATGAGHATPEDAAEVLMARLQGATVKAERRHEQLELEGWLELAWNPAPLLFVAGMNEGLVPDGRVGDLFLPDALRRKLELRDDRLRVADTQCARLEADILVLNTPLAPLKSFVLPGGTAGAAAAHVARTVTRRAERLVVALAAAEEERGASSIRLCRRRRRCLWHRRRRLRQSSRARFLSSARRK